MSGPIGLHAIDGADAFETYGFAVSKGVADFLKFPERKASISKSWDEENGIDIDLSEPKFKEKDITIEGAIFAYGEDDFWAKYKALFNKLAEPGTRRWYVAELKRSFYIYYVSCSSLNRLTRIDLPTGHKIRCDYTFRFVEPVPSFWQEFSFMIDNNDNYLVNSDGSRIIL